MKNVHLVSTMLATLALTAALVAQASSDAPSAESSAEVSRARCAYAADESACSDASASRTGESYAAGDDGLAQIRRPTPPRAGQRRPPIAHPRPIYSFGPPQVSARHAAIGALIGFGLGAAAGLRGNTDQHPGAGVKAAFLVGSFGALIGAAVGSAVPSFQARNRHQRGPWPDDETSIEASLHKGHRMGHRPAALADAAPSTPLPAAIDIHPAVPRLAASQ